MNEINFDLIEPIPEICTLLEYVVRLPKNANVVEVGTYLGGTTTRIAKSRPDINIYTFDAYMGSNWKEPYNEYVTNYLLPILKEKIDKKHLLGNISRYNNIQFFEGESPSTAKSLDLEVDLYFEDGDHYNPGLSKNISYWKNLVKPGGFIIGHDYCSECPDVILEFDKLIDEGFKKLHLFERLIVLQKV